jgi:hypothetical protein
LKKGKKLPIQNVKKINNLLSELKCGENKKDAEDKIKY